MRQRPSTPELYSMPAAGPRVEQRTSCPKWSSQHPDANLPPLLANLEHPQRYRPRKGCKKKPPRQHRRPQLNGVQLPALNRHAVSSEPPRKRNAQPGSVSAPALASARVYKRTLRKKPSVNAKPAVVAHSRDYWDKLLHPWQRAATKANEPRHPTDAQKPAVRHTMPVAETTAKAQSAWDWGGWATADDEARARAETKPGDEDEDDDDDMWWPDATNVPAPLTETEQPQQDSSPASTATAAERPDLVDAAYDDLHGFFAALDAEADRQRAAVVRDHATRPQGDEVASGGHDEVASGGHEENKEPHDLFSDGDDDAYPSTTSQHQCDGEHSTGGRSAESGDDDRQRRVTPAIDQNRDIPTEAPAPAWLTLAQSSSSCVPPPSRDV